MLAEWRDLRDTSNSNMGDLYNLYSSENIIKLMKSKAIGSAVCVLHMGGGMIEVYRNLKNRRWIAASEKPKSIILK
jgi:hypothetical protein